MDVKHYTVKTHGTTRHQISLHDFDAENTARDCFEAFCPLVDLGVFDAVEMVDNRNSSQNCLCYLGRLNVGAIQ